MSKKEKLELKSETKNPQENNVDVSENDEEDYLIIKSC